MVNVCTYAELIAQTLKERAREANIAYINHHGIARTYMYAYVYAP